MTNYKKLPRRIAHRFMKSYDNRRYRSWLQSVSRPGDSEKPIPISYQPLLSVIVPTYNTPERYFRPMIESVLSQTYPHWELVLVDDASPDARVRELIHEYAAKDQRIVYHFLDKNHHIAGATNYAISKASGNFISLFDHDDLLDPTALEEIVKVINQYPDAEFIYSDEDKIDEKGLRQQPFLKPDWNKDFLYSVNYITHFTTIKKLLFKTYGYVDEKYNGAQDWELFLRFTKRIPQSRIHHIPKVIYSWRMHSMSTALDTGAKPYVIESQHNALVDSLKDSGYDFTVDQDDQNQGQWRVRFSPAQPPTITVVSTKPLTITQDLCNIAGCDEFEVRQMEKAIVTKEMVKIMAGNFVLFADRDITKFPPSWAAEMAGDAERDEVGFVVSRLTKQAQNVILSELLGQQRSELITSMTRRQISQHLYATTRYNIDSFPAGTALISREKLLAIMDESKRYTIKALSKAAIAKGYRNLYNPYIKMVK